MKNKIASKLIFYFGISLLLFSIIVGSSFVFFFTRYTTQLHKNELEKRAISISENLSNYLDGHRLGKAGLGAYLKFLDDIAMSDVWVVDSNSRQIIANRGNKTMVYEDLPPDGEKVINEALKGKTTFSEGFGDLLNAKSITVGVPIMDNSNNPIGVVLLHSPLEDTSDAITGGVRVLILSVFAALILAIPAAILLSLRFTRPLKKMKDTALHLADGNYSAKNDISSHDEIGELANTMNILADRLQLASTESQKLEKMRQDFFSNISHELRTPVTVMRGSLEALCDGVITDKGQIEEYHQQMLKESIYLQRLVNDLLELTRLQNTDFAIEMSLLNLQELADDVARSMRHVAEKKRVKILTDIDTTPLTFWGDYGRLRQMLMIILDNAIKFSNEEKTIQFKLHQENNTAIISIIDEGCGISPEDLPFIFNRFYKTNNNNKSGSGLGLTIANHIALRHNIKIDVQSSSGNTQFKLYFQQQNNLI